MRVSTKGFVAALLLVTIVAVPLVLCSRAYREAPEAEAKLQKFLSEVIGIEMSRYNMTNIGSGFSYPLWFGGVVKEEGVSFYLESNDSMVGVSGFFDNGLLTWLTVHIMNGSIIYSRQPSTDALEETKGILQRYKSFAEGYKVNTAHLTSALNLLGGVELASPSTALSMLNNITGFVPSTAASGSMKMETTTTGIKWIYTERGVDMPNKCLVIDFGGNELFFADTWNLFTVGCFSVISEEEAKGIGWDAAKNFDMKFRDENGTEFYVKPPGWSGYVEVGLSMIPGLFYNRDPNDHFVDPGSAVRDPLALYPLWQMVFYFNASVGGAVGIQVGVWGDTKEIAYISEYGYLGDLGGNSSLSVVASSPSESSTVPSEAPAEPDNDWSSSVYLLVGLVATAVVVAIAAVALRKRSK
ncbi:MAG: hypothetical protein QW674_06465 [Candidatus Bathyarchaeia archaeon]